MTLLSVAEAQDRLFALTPSPQRSERIPLRQADGRVLAEGIAAPFDLPRFANSSMDGFAVRAADTHGASRTTPVVLQVVGDVPAGRDVSGLRLEAGQAMRVMTGAPIPEGADAVIPIEDTDQARESGASLPDHVRLFRPARPAEAIRPIGRDVRRGEKVFSPGHRLRPADLGLLAMFGVAEVMVYARPRVALFSGGDELLPLGAPLLPGKIYESNSVVLEALLRRHGAEMLFLGILPDRLEAIAQAFEQAVTAEVDLILSTAGVSVGAFDLVRAALERGGRLDFWRVNVRPGKPLAVGRYRQTLFIGLPGNPVSAFVGFELFVRPVIARLSGVTWQPRRRQRVILDESVESDGRESYLRAVVTLQDGRYHARLSAHQDSGNLLSLVAANALLIVPSGVKSLSIGTEVEAFFLDE